MARCFYSRRAIALLIALAPVQSPSGPFEPVLMEYPGGIGRLLGPLRGGSAFFCLAFPAAYGYHAEKMKNNPGEAKYLQIDMLSSMLVAFCHLFWR
jgi:hypothetical protein